LETVYLDKLQVGQVEHFGQVAQVGQVGQVGHVGQGLGIAGLSNLSRLIKLNLQDSKPHPLEVLSHVPQAKSVYVGQDGEALPFNFRQFQVLNFT
jgi:hypothetical protein